MRNWIIGLAVVAAGIGVATVLMTEQPKAARGERHCREKCVAEGKGYIYSAPSQQAGERCTCMGQPGKKQ